MNPSLMKQKKSKIVSDTGANGGKMNITSQVVSGAVGALFAQVSQTDRTTGVKKYRKVYDHYEGTDASAVYNFRRYFTLPSIGDDLYLLGKGTQDDTQADIVSFPPLYVGVGDLNANITAGDLSVVIDMEVGDAGTPESLWVPGGWVFIHNPLLSGQTAAANVNTGDSVAYNSVSGNWEFIAFTIDTAYPKGKWLGNGTVYTKQTGSYQSEFVQIDSALTENKSIGTGDGANATIVLTDLTVTNGLVPHTDYSPVVTTLATDDSPLTVTVGADGVCSGDCVAGELNLSTGVWVTDIEWSSIPKSGAAIQATYYDRPDAVAGSVVTLSLGSGVLNNYVAAETVVSGVLEYDELVPALTGWTVTGTGTYDIVTNPPTLRGDSTIEASWLIEVTGANAIRCTRVDDGVVVGTGDLTSNFAPVNSDTGYPFFTIAAAGWTGMQVGDYVEFDTSPQAASWWYKQDVPTNTPAIRPNVVGWGWYAE